MNRITRMLTTTACVVLLGAIGAACGEDAGAGSPATTTERPADPDTTVGHEDTAEHGDVAVTVDGVDYGFENVPASVPAGTRLGFRNTSENELHELVAFRLDTDTPIAELLAQPPTSWKPRSGRRWP